MAQSFKNGEEYYNKVYLQFNLFIAISLLPFGYLLLLKQSGQLQTSVFEPWYSVLSFGLLMAITAISYQSYKNFTNFLETVDSTMGLRNKLEGYHKNSVRKYLGFMLAGLICVSGFYLTVNTLFIIAYIVTLILLSIKRPTLNTLIDDLKLSAEERQLLIDKEPIP